ncbi:MAG: LTA synthase family protein [Tenuifilaceae bacterium]
MNYRYLNYLTSLKILFRIFFLGLLILFISRIIFLVAFGDFNDLSGYILDLLYSFVMGLRFDIKVLAFGLIPLFLLSLGQFLNYTKPSKYGFYNRFSLVYSLFLFSLIIIISSIDFYFFKFFHTRISVLFFGIIEDDTVAVLKSVWTDYPIIIISISFLVVFIALIFVLNKLVKTVAKHYYVESNALRFFFVLLFCGIYFLGLRGSVGLIPLDVRYSTISNNSFINSLTLNGVFSLKTAYSDRKISTINTDIPEMLRVLNFKTAEEAVTGYLERNIIDSTNLANNLLSTTPTDSLLERDKPNVVFVFMESMSNYYLNFHSAETNLLGKLEDQLKDCYLFRNFLSSTSGTIYSLESVLVGTPNSPLSQSVYQNRSLSTSVAKPFHDKGYSTSFVTGGSLGWRNLDKFINHQYFDNVEGESALEKFYPNASTCEWGVNDEYIFDRVFQILNQRDTVPKFVFSFTVSNHTPYEVPDSYQKYPLTITDDIKSRIKVTPEMAYKNLLSYQYANNCLGQFLENLRNSPQGENTIVVATGDHNILQLFEFTDADLLWKHSVPLVIYVPEKFKPKHVVDTKVFGSHKDIFPTIFNLSLSNSTYLNTGNNLLSKDSKKGFGVFYYYLAISPAGCVDFQRTPLNYVWQDSTHTSLLPTDQPNMALDSLLYKAKAYKASMSYYIMSELKSKKVGE